MCLLHRVAFDESCMMQQWTAEVTYMNVSSKVPKLLFLANFSRLSLGNGQRRHIRWYRYGKYIEACIMQQWIYSKYWFRLNDCWPCHPSFSFGSLKRCLTIRLMKKTLGIGIFLWRCQIVARRTTGPGGKGNLALYMHTVTMATSDL